MYGPFSMYIAHNFKDNNYNTKKMVAGLEQGVVHYKKLKIHFKPKFIKKSTDTYTK